MKHETPKITPANEDALLRGLAVFPPTFSDTFDQQVEVENSRILEGTPGHEKKDSSAT